MPEEQADNDLATAVDEVFNEPTPAHEVPAVDETPQKIAEEEPVGETPTQDDASPEIPAVSQEEPGKTPLPDLPFLGTYKTKEIAEEGIREKDRTIEKLKTKLEVYERPAQKPAQPAQSPEEAWEKYTEELDLLAESKGQYAANARLIRDVVSQLNFEKDAKEQAKLRQYDAWKEELKISMPGISNEAITRLVEKYEVLSKQTNLNPLTILHQAEQGMGGSVKEINASLKKDALNKQKRQIPNTKPTRIASSIEDDELQQKVAESVKKGDFKGTLDAVFARQEEFLEQEQRLKISR